MKKNLLLLLTLLFTVGIGQMWGTTDTYSCSTPSNATSPITGTSTNGYFTVTFAKGTATNWYTTSQSHWRVYENSTVTITPKSGIKITKIELTVSSSSYPASRLGCPWEGESENPVVLTATAQCRPTEITVTYETAVAADPCTVTLDAGSGCVMDEELTETSAGEGVTLPTPTLNGCDEWEFAGWAETSVDEETDEKPTLIPAGTYSPTGDITLYAVYSLTEKGNGGGSASVTGELSFSDTKNRTSYSTTKQVWEQNEITLTNDKSSSTSNVGDYADPARFYKSSKITITAPGNITQIKFNCVSSYVISITGATTSGTTVTVILDGTSDTYTIKSLSAQVRLNSISVTYTTSGGTSSTTYYHSTPECAPTINCDLLTFATNIAENHSATYTENTTANALTVSAKYNDNTTGVTYQWYSNSTKSNTGGTAITVATNASYTPLTSATGTKYYYCVATYDECTITSNVATVVVNAAVTTYTVTFDSDGGSAVTTQTIEEGKTATKPTDPTKKGYEFAGWYNENTEFDFDTPITGNITLKAKWNSITYNIEYIGLEGATRSNPKTYDVETETITFTAPSNRDGYVFKGWNPASITKGSTGDKTVNAQWAAVHKITWMVGGNEYNTGDPTTSVESGQKITAIPTAPADETLKDCGATKFMGWSESNIGSIGQDEAPNDLFTTVPANPISENKTFYAVFAAAGAPQTESVTVTQSSFASTSGNLNSDTNISYNSYKGEGTTNPAISSNAIRLYQNSNGKTGGYIIIKAATGCTITSASITSASTYATTTTTGYLLSAPASTPSKSDFVVSNYSLAKSSTYTVSGINTSAITFACFGTTSNTRLDIAKISVTYTKQGAPSYSNYVTNCCATPTPTNGTYTSVSGTEIKLTWEDAANTNSYHITGGNLSAEGVYPINEKYYNVTGLTECEEYTFYVSAYPEDGCESATIEIPVKPYIPKTVTFDDGTTTMTQTTSCTSKTVIVPTPTAQNCSTYVWIDEATGTKYTAGQTITPAKDMTIVAKWSVITHTITFKDWDGTQLQQSTVECGQTPSYTGETPTKEADAVYQYTFADWSPAIVPAKDNATYTATYNKTKQIYTVEWYVNGKWVKTEQVEAKDYATAPDIAEVPCGAVIAGWTDAEGGKYEHDSSTLHQGAKPSIQILSNKKFYAVFADIDE